MASEIDKINLGKAPVATISRAEAEKMQFCEICDNVLVDCIKGKSTSMGRPCAYCPCNDCTTTAQLQWAKARITNLEYQRQEKHIMWESGQDRIVQLEENLSIKDAQLLEVIEEAARADREVAELTKELESTQIERDNMRSENTDLCGRLEAAMVWIKGRRSAQRKGMAPGQDLTASPAAADTFLASSQTDGLVINPDIGSPAFQVKSARALAADRLLEAESQSPVRIPAIRAQVNAISRVAAQCQPGSTAKQAPKALQQASPKAALQRDTAGIAVPKATLLKKKQQPAPGKLLAITQHGEPQGKRKRAINCHEGSGLILALCNTASPTPAPYLPSLGSPLPARGKEVLLLDSKPFNDWLPDADIIGIEKDVTDALDINMDALGDIPEMMDPEAELADFTPYNPTILLLEGHKAATSTCDNTDVLRMESPLADDTCAWNNIEALDISTDSLGEMPDMSGYMAELEDLISASHISTSMDMHKTEGGSTLTGPFNKPENALPKKDSNTVHARASLLADHFTIHKTADAAPQHAQEMASRTSPATTGNSGPSAIAGACHTRSAALSHFPALSADSGILTEGGMASGDISNADVIADDVGDGPNYKPTTDCLMLSAMAPSRPSSASSATCMSDEVAVRNLPKKLALLPDVPILKCSYNDQEWSMPAKPSTAAEGVQKDKKNKAKGDSAAAGGQKGKKTIKDLAQKAGRGCKKMARGIKTGLQAIRCFSQPRVMDADQ